VLFDISKYNTHIVIYVLCVLKCFMETNYVRDYKLYVSHNILYTYIVLPVDVSVGFHLDKKKCTYATSNGAIDFR